jgi:hypothetical protein
MDLFAVLDHVREQLQRRRRITYRMLQAQFKLSEGDVEALKVELIDGQQVATDEGGKVLVWVGDGEATPKPISPPAQSQPPAAYTPPHLVPIRITRRPGRR